MKKFFSGTAIAISLLMLHGCSPNHVITQELVAPLAESAWLEVGQIKDQLPADTELGDRPTSEDLDKFRQYLVEEMAKRSKLTLQIVGGEKAAAEQKAIESYSEFEVATETAVLDQDSPGDGSSQVDSRYRITGNILEYTKGSGFLRFMFGFGAGSAKVVTQLMLEDLESGQVVYSGNFEGVVRDWADSGDKMFKFVAKEFSKSLEKKCRELVDQK